MFQPHESKRHRTRRSKLPLFLAVAAGLNATAATAITFFSRRAEKVEAHEIEVSLRSPPKPAAVPPPPVPIRPPPAKQLPRPLTLPKVVARPLVAPKEVPLKKLEEAEPTATETAAGGDGPVEAGAVSNAAPPGPAVVAKVEPPPPPPPKKNVPIDLPEEADPPEPHDDNATPEYPEEARTKGLQGKVVLKLAISETGQVVGVTVLKGEEPFVGAAVKVARTWRYEPARLAGEAFATFKIVVIPFELKAG